MCAAVRRWLWLRAAPASVRRSVYWSELALSVLLCFVPDSPTGTSNQDGCPGGLHAILRQLRPQGRVGKVSRLSLTWFLVVIRTCLLARRGGSSPTCPRPDLWEGCTCRLPELNAIRVGRRRQEVNVRESERGPAASVEERAGWGCDQYLPRALGTSLLSIRYISLSVSVFVSVIVSSSAHETAASEPISASSHF